MRSVETLVWASSPDYWCQVLLEVNCRPPAKLSVNRKLARPTGLLPLHLAGCDFITVRQQGAKEKVQEDCGLGAAEKMAERLRSFTCAMENGTCMCGMTF